jgi:peptidylprolyl isomerase domain and WD repeat-containing protein 1
MYTAAPHNAVVSTDAAGMLEIWNPISLSLPQSVTFKFKSDTGLYDLAKAKTYGKSIEVACPLSLALRPNARQVSPTGEMFSVVTASKKILVYRVATGRRCAEIDESLEIVHESQKHSNVRRFARGAVACVVT